MSLPHRLGTALFPATSVYADLDNPLDPFPNEPVDTRSSSSSADTRPGHHDGSLAPTGSRLADDDPFSAVTPSVLSPASARSRDAQLHPPPHLDQRGGQQDYEGARAGGTDVQEQDERDPFAVDPTAASPKLDDSRALSPTPTGSLYLPAQDSSQQHPHFPPSHAPSTASVASSSRTRTSSGAGGSKSAIGNRSLMGLLGGTRYEGGGFPFGGIGVGEVEEEDEEEDEEERVGMRHEEQGLRTPRKDDLHDIAASLPPPPSALSSSSRDDEEEDDEAPPDFTSRIPLMASTSGRARVNPLQKARRAVSPSTASSSSHRTRRGAPVGGILGSTHIRRSLAGMNAKERALWRWVNVTDLDAFLQQVYLYYVGKGIWAIGLERTLNLLTVGWVIGFSTFLVGCIDYPRLWDSHKLSEVVIPRCTSRMSGFTLLLFIAFAAFYAWRVVRFGMGVRRLWDMHEFYTELLEVPESDIQTIPWHAIVARLSALRASHPSALSSRAHSSDPARQAERLDAHDVANRIMREENYLIALFNKSLLDISLPLPQPVARLVGKKRFGKSMLTQTLEWNLSFCLLGFLFGRDGQVRRAFLSERNKKELVEALRRRFILMGLINAVFAPFIVLYLLMYSFFRYFEEYHKNPSSIGSRQFTPLARWKFREFNELPHHFQQRLALAHPLADQYINHYPKAKTVLLSRFVAFLAGSFAAVLILFSLIDPDAFLHFEITPGRTVLFYIGVFGTILAVARGMSPDDNRVVDPEELMRNIVEHTHYLPNEWKDKLHSAEVHVAFGKLFQMKVSLFLQELFSVLITPVVLWYSLPKCAGPVVDFFREFTVHVDGLGYVCSFAVFDFKRHGDPSFGAPVQVQDARWKSAEGKMEQSFLTFAASNPAWVPRDQAQSLFLSKMTEAPPSAGPVHPHPASSTALHSSLHLSTAYPRSRNHSAFPHSRQHSSRLAASPFTLPEEDAVDAPVQLHPSTGGQAQRRAEKARMYDRAFQQSALLGSASTAGGPRSAMSPPRRGHGMATRAGHDAVIQEESALDGEGPFVAPSDAQPFGLPSDDEDDAEGMRGVVEDGSRGGETEVERLKRKGLGGLVGELYRR
ncbi:autophagy protein atg9 [Rhodotorula toruloides]